MRVFGGGLKPQEIKLITSHADETGLLIFLAAFNHLFHKHTSELLIQIIKIKFHHLSVIFMVKQSAMCMISV
jgi:hypothetical protein